MSSWVADRGLLSLDNIGGLTTLADQGVRKLCFILEVAARRYTELVGTFRRLPFSRNGLVEARFASHRLIVAHDPLRAEEQAARRRARIAELNADRFSRTLDETAMAAAELFDGKLALLTNAPDLSPAEVVHAIGRWPI